MQRKTTLRATSLALALVVLASAVSFATVPIDAVATNTVDLTTWQQRGPAGNGVWTVGGGGTSVTQSIDSNDGPTYFVSNGVEMADVYWTGTVTTPGSDDDFIGWSIEHVYPAAGGTFQKTILLDWKSAEQTHLGYTAPEGFTLTEVGGDDVPPTPANIFACFWGKVDADCPVPITVLQASQGLGTGWEPSTSYDWTLRVGNNGAESHIWLQIVGGTGIYAGGAVPIYFVGDFDAEELGFYTFSQGGVTWSDVDVTDDVKPTITSAAVCSTLGLAGWCLGSIDASGSATDRGFGIDTVECKRVSPLLIVDCAGHTFTDDQATTFRVTATDLAGNTLLKQHAIKIDQTKPELAPTVLCDGGGDPLACTTFLTFSGTATDARSGVALGFPTCELNGAGALCAGTVTAVEGLHDFGMDGKDKAGNTNNTNITGIVDLSPPEAIAGADCWPWEVAGWCIRYVDTEGTGVDAFSGIASVECLFDGLPTSCASTERRQEGTHTFQVNATDLAGHADINVTTWKVDSTGPVGAITAPEPGCRYMDDAPLVCTGLVTTASGPLTFNVTGGDALSGLQRAEFWVDGWHYVTQYGDGSAPFLWTWDTTAENVGDHRVQVRLLDNASNFRVMFFDVTVLP